MKSSEVTKNPRLWLHSPVDRHHMEIAWQETPFVDDVCGGVLEAERVKQARRVKAQLCRGMGVWEPVLRKDMDAEGAKAVSLLWIDTNKGDAGRPNYRS